jgi:hypothetical protein
MPVSNPGKTNGGIERARRAVSQVGLILIVACLVAGLALAMSNRADLASNLFRASVAVLVLMPITGVIAVLAEEIARRDWWFAAIAAGVLVLIVANLRKLVL